jgi:hypothetical protein
MGIFSRLAAFPKLGIRQLPYSPFGGRARNMRFNPYQQRMPFMGGGFNPYMGGGFNPYMGGGFNPYQQRMPFMGGGFNPYMGGGFNPYMGGGFNPYQQQRMPSPPTLVTPQPPAIRPAPPPAFDPSGLEARLGALENREIPRFDPSALQRRLGALENREIPTLNPGKPRPIFVPPNKQIGRPPPVKEPMPRPPLNRSTGEPVPLPPTPSRRPIGPVPLPPTPSRRGMGGDPIGVALQDDRGALSGGVPAGQSPEMPPLNPGKPRPIFVPPNKQIGRPPSVKEPMPWPPLTGEPVPLPPTPSRRPTGPQIMPPPPVPPPPVMQPPPPPPQIRQPQMVAPPPQLRMAMPSGGPESQPKNNRMDRLAQMRRTNLERERLQPRPGRPSRRDYGDEEGLDFRRDLREWQGAGNRQVTGRVAASPVNPARTQQLQQAALRRRQPAMSGLAGIPRARNYGMAMAMPSF